MKIYLLEIACNNVVVVVVVLRVLPRVLTIATAIPIATKMLTNIVMITQRREGLKQQRDKNLFDCIFRFPW